MNLASGGGEVSMDSGALLGMGKSFSERDLKWEAPKQLVEKSKPPPSRLPSWLEDFDASDLKDPPLRLLQPGGTSNDIAKGAVVEKIDSENPSLESELQESNTIEEIRRAAFHHNTAVSRNKGHSALGFGRLLDSDSPMPILLQFLEDEELNNPAARNLAALMAWGIMEKTHDEIGSLNAWLEQRIAPGLLSESEIQSLLHGLSLSFRHKPLPWHARWRTWSIYKSIWQGIQASKINGIPNLGSDTIRQLLEAASRSPDLSEGRGIGMKILKMRKDKLRNLLPNISHFALQLSETPLSRLPHGSIGPEEDWSFSWFYPLLALIPQKDASAIIVNLSWKLTRRLLNRERNGDLMAQEWFSVLTPEVLQAARKDPKWTEKWWLIDRDLASSTRPDGLKTLASYLQPFEDKERYLFLLRSWVPPRWPRGDKIKIYVFSEASADTASWKEFIRKIELEPYFPGIDPDTMLLDIVQRLHKTYLEVLRTILPDLLHLLRCLGQSSAIIRIARYLKDHNVHVDYSTWTTEVTAHLRHNLSLAFSLFQLDTRLRFEDCPGLAEALITSPSLPTAPIFHLMQRQRRTIGSVPLPQTSNSERLLAITPERVALLHRMALAFANAAHLSPRQAYRGVSRCAQYFRDRPDLLKPEMATALATAGVLRYLERGMWVSTVRFAYVLGMVRGLEGEAVAGELDRVVWEWGRENRERAEREGEGHGEAEVDGHGNGDREGDMGKDGEGDMGMRGCSEETVILSGGGGVGELRGYRGGRD